MLDHTWKYNLRHKQSGTKIRPALSMVDVNQWMLDAMKLNTEELVLVIDDGLRKCHTCGIYGRRKTHEMRLCGGCRRVRYCSTTCQSDHWLVHKKYCNMPLSDRKKIPFIVSLLSIY